MEWGGREKKKENETLTNPQGQRRWRTNGREQRTTGWKKKVWRGGEWRRKAGSDGSTIKSPIRFATAAMHISIAAGNCTSFSSLAQQLMLRRITKSKERRNSIRQDLYWWGLYSTGAAADRLFLWCVTVAQYHFWVATDAPYFVRFLSWWPTKRQTTTSDLFLPVVRRSLKTHDRLFIVGNTLSVGGRMFSMQPTKSDLLF